MERRKSKRDYTFPIVLALLLLFPFAVDQMFVQLRYVLHSGGFFAMSDLEPRQKPLKNQHCRGTVRGGKGYDPAWPACGSTASVALDDEMNTAASALASFSANPGGSIEALGAAERAEWDVLRGRKAHSIGERWFDIAPMDSNPSRHFPEPHHPMLASGVPLTTGRTDSHWEDPMPPEKEQQPAPQRSIASIATPAASSAIAPPPPALQAPPKAGLPDWPEIPRLEFHAKAPSAKPDTERLQEVCGRMVPESQVYAATNACAAKASKPKDSDEGGNDTLLMP
jgi:hypothetical protein